MGVLKNIFGSKNDRTIKRLRPLVDSINKLEDKYHNMSDEELRNQTIIFRKELAKGKTLTEILPFAFAVVREAAVRALGMRHYDVQLIGGIVLHQGKVAEMKTGEGKTLVATLPVYLNALLLYSKWIEAAKKTYGEDPDNWIYEDFYRIKKNPSDKDTWEYVSKSKAIEKFGKDRDYWEYDSDILPIGRGAHLVTVNDYLAKRDAEWMGKVYRFLGMDVGVIIHGLDDEERKTEYAKDISYGTNNEFGFDYLRDNMKYDIDDYVQRDHSYCIVDEVDSILIDEARTPLIISGPKESNIEKYAIVDKVVRTLKEEVHYTVDIKDKLVLLTDAGVTAVEKGLNIKNLYDPSNIEYMHHVEQSLKAHVIFKEGIDYVVKDGKVIIVDEFTGRLMDGRSWSDGLHQAVEAKEAIDTPIRIQRLLGKGVDVPLEDRVPPEVANENQTLATVTFQNYFRMYDKLSGMTGTADTEATEFNKIYKLDTVVIPTNKPIARKDKEDLIYRTIDEKMNAIVEEIKRVSIKGQPILVGTVAIESSEEISEALSRAKISHKVLNAKHHKQEASIVAQAGRYGSVTVATNMAGRGTDIKLGGSPQDLALQDIQKMAEIPEDEEYNKLLENVTKKYEPICEEEKKKVIDAGGLYILGTERHESRRIDNQLRGRSGRQGDPGESRFFISLEDDLMRRFGGEKISGIMSKLGYKEGQPITHKMISKTIANAQKKVENVHFDIRKNVLEYDDVMNMQRNTIYTFRKNLLDGIDLKEQVLDILEEITISIIDYAIGDNLARPDEWNRKYIIEKVKDIFDVELSEIDDIQDREKFEDLIFDNAEKIYNKKEKEFGEKNARQIERYYYLQTLDTKWKDHLLNMDLLRESIGLRGYAQKDPKIEYKREGYARFVSMMYNIKEEFIKKLFHTELNESHFVMEENLQDLDEINMNLSEISEDMEKESMLAAMNANLTGFSWEDEKEEYNKMMQRMQSGIDLETIEKESKKKKARKFVSASKKKKKKK